MDSALITNIVLILAGVVFVLQTIYSKNGDRAKDTITILEKSLAAKDMQILEMKANHDSEIAKLRADLNALTAQIEHLKEANIVLANTVTGKETLMAITEILKPFPPLFISGGFLDTVKTNQEKALKDLSEIREALHLSPDIETPKNRKFVKRQNPQLAA